MVVVQFDMEASQTRDYSVAQRATVRAARPDPSLRKERSFGMTNQTAPLPEVLLRCHFEFRSRFRVSAVVSSGVFRCARESDAQSRNLLFLSVGGLGGVALKPAFGLSGDVESWSSQCRNDSVERLSICPHNEHRVVWGTRRRRPRGIARA